MSEDPIMDEAARSACSNLDLRRKQQLRRKRWMSEDNTKLHAEVERLRRMVADLKSGAAVAQVVAACDVLRAANLRLREQRAQRDRALEWLATQLAEAELRRGCRQTSGELIEAALAAAEAEMCLAESATEDR